MPVEMAVHLWRLWSHFEKLAKHWIYRAVVSLHPKPGRALFLCLVQKMTIKRTVLLVVICRNPKRKTTRAKANKVHKFKLLWKWKECRSKKGRSTARINNHLTFYLCIRSLIKTFVIMGFSIQGFATPFGVQRAQTTPDIMMSSNGSSTFDHS